MMWTRQGDVGFWEMRTLRNNTYFNTQKGAQWGLLLLYFMLWIMCFLGGLLNVGFLDVWVLNRHPVWHAHTCASRDEWVQSHSDVDLLLCVPLTEQRVQSLLPVKERLLLRVPPQKQQVSEGRHDAVGGRGYNTGTPALTDHKAAPETNKRTRIQTDCFIFYSFTEYEPADWPHDRENTVWGLNTSGWTHLCLLRRYFGFITKHPADQRFACHVFVSEDSTKPLAESIGWVLGLIFVLNK